MGFFNRILSKPKKEDSSIVDEPVVLFGRYTDRNKTKEQYESWDKAVNLFKEKKYVDAYFEFFNYLKDKEIENMTYERKGSKISFSLIQGSKIVHGFLNETEIQAEAEVARFEEQNIAVMRKLLQENYYLYFSKFAVKNDVYTLKYFSPVEDAHPSSLYYALKELATEADMYDDVLVEEFDDLKPINTEHIEEIPDDEKQVKLKYLRKWINDTLDRIQGLDSDRYTGAIAYNLLNLAFKIYYLIAPEGTLLDDIRFIQSLFYREDEKNPKEKNHAMIDEFKALVEKADEEILKSFYKVKATFAVASPTAHKIIADFMKNELEKTKSYSEDHQPEIIQEICEYIISYSCFSYGMPAVAVDILMIFWRVFNRDFFKDLGFKHSFFELEDEKLNKEHIVARINHIISHSKKRHSNIVFNADNLDFSNKIKFAISFINEFQYLNYD